MRILFIVAALFALTGCETLALDSVSVSAHSGYHYPHHYYPRHHGYHRYYRQPVIIHRHVHRRPVVVNRHVYRTPPRNQHPRHNWQNDRRHGRRHHRDRKHN